MASNLIAMASNTQDASPEEFRKWIADELHESAVEDPMDAIQPSLYPVQLPVPPR